MAEKDEHLMRSYFTHLHYGDAEEAAEITANRLGHLVTIADLSSFSYDNFRTICQLFNGLDTSGLTEGKTYLTSVLTDSVHEADFPDVLGRQADLSSILHAVEKLDPATALALLVRVEEVYAENRAGMDLETSCHEAYAKMKTRRFL